MVEKKDAKHHHESRHGGASIGTGEDITEGNQTGMELF
jgi:hypothetical protein